MDRGGAELYLPYELPDRSGEEGVSTNPHDDYRTLDCGADFLVSGDSDLLQIPEAHVRILSPRPFWEDVLVPLL
jgi:hypothetical protein